jgi:hypothetical protein
LDPYLPPNFFDLAEGEFVSMLIVGDSANVADEVLFDPKPAVEGEVDVVGKLRLQWKNGHGFKQSAKIRKASKEVRSKFFGKVKVAELVQQCLSPLSDRLKIVEHTMPGASGNGIADQIHIRLRDRTIHDAAVEASMETKSPLPQHQYQKPNGPAGLCRNFPPNPNASGIWGDVAEAQAAPANDPMDVSAPNGTDLLRKYPQRDARTELRIVPDHRTDSTGTEQSTTKNEKLGTVHLAKFDVVTLDFSSGPMWRKITDPDPTYRELKKQSPTANPPQHRKRQGSS